MTENTGAAARATEAPGAEPRALIVVGIGASAGGVTATKRFFENTAENSGFAYVVVLHLSEEHESHLAQILQSATTMPVVQVTERITVQPNHVYVIPPAKHIVMDDGTLRLVEPEHVRGRRVPIDLFFRSLAEAYGKNAVAVVLSGTGSDGTLGLERIKEMGGFTVVQDPEEAEYDGMPRSALSSGLIDLVLPLVEIPEKLRRVVKIKEPLEGAANSGAHDDDTAGSSLRDVLSLVQVRTGHDFSNYKRPTLRRRIARRLQVHELTDLGAYVELLRSQPDEVTYLLRDLLITVTNFFRDPEAFAALESEIVPKLFAGKTAQETVRVWVAGCGTGEEAYSIGMLLLEHAEKLSSPPRIQIFASDINAQAIRIGRTGQYDEAIAVDVSPERLLRFFVKEGNSYRVKKELRELVLFAPHNLLRDPPFSKLDLVSCRNLLIYLNRPTQERVMELFHFSLNISPENSGFLFLGSSESAESSAVLFETVDKKHRLFRARSTMQSQTQSQNRAAPPIMPAGGKWLPERWLTERLHGLSDQPLLERNRPASFSDLHYQLLERLSAPSVLVDEGYEILHASEHAVRFLRFSGGEPTHNLLKVVLPGLMMDLRGALIAAAKDGRATEARHVRFEMDGAERSVNIIVRPEREDGSGLLLVILEEQPLGTAPDAPQSVSETLRSDRAIESVVARLEEESQATRERLKSTVEQYEISTEELKASNEELQAINEELRSASEELETSKEELQSLNEELTTVNHELKDNVDEVTRVNSDLQNLVSATDIGTIFLNRALCIKRFTPRTLDIFNLIPSDIGRPLAHVTHKLNYEHLPAMAAQVLETLRSQEREITNVEDGSLYLARLSPYRTLDDRIDGVVISFVDVTEMRRTRDALREYEERFRAIISQATAGIAQSDLTGKFLLVNDRYCQLTGLSRERLLAMNLLGTTHGDDAAEESALFAAMIAHGTPFKMEKRLLRQDGSEVWINNSVSLILDADGQKKFALSIAIDISERKAAEEAVRVSDRRKDEFLATLSHELRNPLNALRASFEVMRRLESVAELKSESLQAIQPLEMMQRLVDDLLDVARISEGKLRLRFAPTNVMGVLSATAQTMRSRFTAGGRELILNLPEALGTVSGDAVRLEQVFTNLLSNAVKYSDPGARVWLSAECEGGDAIIRIKDSGIGLSKEGLEGVFGLFSQVKSEGSRIQDGLGIGLYLVKRIIELHGGGVSVRSDGLGHGSEFTVRLPVIAAQVTALPVSLEPPDAAPTAQLEPAGDPTTPKRWRILLADDYEPARKAIARLLKYMGYEVASAVDGPDALKQAAEFKPELILLDINMPGINGYEVARALRANPEFRKTVLIALTGYGQPEDIRRASEAGFNGHIVKPLDPDALEQMLRDRAWSETTEAVPAD